MTIKGKAYIAGAFEHPTRHAPDKTVAQLHAEVALGALADAGLTRDDVDGYFCAGDAPGPGPAVDGRLHGPEAAPRRFDGARRLVLCRARRAMPPRRSRRQMQRRADHAGRAAAHARAWRPARRLDGATEPARGARSSIPTARPRSTATPCARCATCTNTARPASSWPGSRSPPRTTRSATRTPCCARW